MRVIIAGGSGLMGSFLTADLAMDGHEVIVLSRSPEKIKDLPAGARAVGYDARTAQGWASLADGADAIVNLAGESIGGTGFFPERWTPERKRLIGDSRARVGDAVVEAVRAAARKPEVVIQSSAIGYYGPREDELVTEEHPPGDDFLARTAVEWEASTQEVEQMGVRRVVMRTGLPLTPEGGVLPRLTLPFKLFAGGWLGDGRQYYSWIHMTDWVAGVRFLMEKLEAGGVYNLTAPNPVTNREFARTLGRVMKRPSFFPVPGLAMRLLFGEVATVVLDGQRVVPERLQKAGFEFRYPQLEPALRDLLGQGTPQS